MESISSFGLWAAFGTIVVAMLVALSLFHYYTAGFGLLREQTHRGIHMAFVLGLIFLVFAWRRRDENRAPRASLLAPFGISWLDWLFALAAVFGAHTQPSAQELADFWAVVSYDRGHRIAHRILAYLRERHVHRDRWVRAMQTTDAPLRFIDGLADPVSGADMVARYRELIPKADVVELPAIGHYPQVEAPDRVLAACTAIWDAFSQAAPRIPQ